MKLFVGNFDFEHNLGRAASRTLPAALKRLNAELAACMAAIADDRDFVWIPESIDAEFAEHLQSQGFPAVRFVGRACDVPREARLCPWGWTERLREWGTGMGWHCESPAPAVVAAVNARELSSRLEREWNVGLPQSGAVRTLDELRAAVAEAGRRYSGWVVKANFGMSARERILGRGLDLSDQAMAWAHKRFVENGAVYFEPWVEPIEELGFQFNVPSTGDPILEGITPLLTDSQGIYRGSRCVEDSLASRSDLPLDVVIRAARKVQQIGYFGPLGIDAMKYRTAENEIRWRPLQDINARWTMGRLALGLSRLLRPKECGSWLHVRSTGMAAGTGERITRLERSLPAGARLVRTSPREVGGLPPGRLTLFLAAPSIESLESVERMVHLHFASPSKLSGQ